ncbi:MAG: hypothetical protein QNK37_00605 [Acidobacteriota bacterium]|nr:hypothetical protein [Acidobacteriota bacterium]
MDMAADQVRQLQKRIQRVLMLKWTQNYAAGWLFCIGALVLLLRYFNAWSDRGYLLGLTFLPLLFFAWRRAQAGVPAETNLRAWLDRHYDQGGLLMASAERDLGGWQPKAIGKPKIQNRARAEMGRLAASLLFLALALVVPYQWVRGFAPPPMDITDELARVEEKIETLEDTQILEKDDSQDVQKELDRLRQEAAGDDPGKTWESLDHLEKTLGRKAEEAARSMEEKQEMLERLEQLVEAAEQNPNGVDRETLEQAMKELSRLTAETASENEQLAEALKNMGLDDKLNPSQSGLQKTDLAKVAKALDLSKKQLEELKAKLSKARLVDASQLKKGKGKKGKELGKDELMAFLDGEGIPCKGLKALCVGRGGISRGPGAAELTWKDPSAEEDSDFQTVVLQPADLDELDNSVQFGVSTAAPERGDAGTGRNDALSGSRAGSGSAHTRTVLPRHRAAVKRYFDKSGKQ